MCVWFASTSGSTLTEGGCGRIQAQSLRQRTALRTSSRHHRPVMASGCSRRWQRVLPLDKAVEAFVVHLQDRHLGLHAAHQITQLLQMVGGGERVELDVCEP